MRAVLVVAILAGLAEVLHAQTTATISGVLVSRDGRLPIEGGRVAVLGTAIVAASDSSGRFVLTGVPAGVRVLQARAIGFAVGSWLLELSEGQAFSDTLALENRVVTLEAVTAVADPNDWRSEAAFDRRRASGDGYFVTREDIAQRRAQSVADLMRQVPGLITLCRAGNCRIMMMRSTRSCSPEYFLDGYPATLSTGANFPVGIGSIRGIEVYSTASEAPAEFQRIGLRCGVIAIWTVNPGERLGSRR